MRENKRIAQKDTEMKILAEKVTVARGHRQDVDEGRGRGSQGKVK